MLFTLHSQKNSLHRAAGESAFSGLCHSLGTQDPGDSGSGDSSSIHHHSWPCCLGEGAPVLSGKGICGTFAVKEAHSSRGREYRWNSGSSSPFLRPRAAHSYMTQRSLETDISNGELVWGAGCDECLGYF